MPTTAYQYDRNLLPIGQQLALKHLETFEEFPPMQSPPSYNLEQVMVEIDAQKRVLRNRPHASE